MKRLAKKLLKRNLYRVVRKATVNRFQAIDTSVANLKNRGLRPTLIVDGGANIGAFATDMLRVFPDTLIHCFEPQPGCQPELEALQRAQPRIINHSVALCGPDQRSSHIGMETDVSARSTGAYVTCDASKERIRVPCITLDGALVPYLKEDDIIFMKLDLQGYELQALLGATETLLKTDCVLTEVSFYTQPHNPTIAELVALLAELGFELYDIASMFARPRDNRLRQGDFVFVRRTSGLASDTAWS